MKTHALPAPRGGEVSPRVSLLNPRRSPDLPVLLNQTIQTEEVRHQRKRLHQLLEGAPEEVPGMPQLKLWL